MKIVKSMAVAAAALALGGSVFAEGLNVNGLFRAGIDFNLDGDDSTFDTMGYVDGDYFGNGKERLRVNVDYDTERAGVTFRFQADKTYDIFNKGEIKWAMGYANFMDGMLTVTGGKLVENWTFTDGAENFCFDGGQGLGIVFQPIEGLAINGSFQGADADTVSWNNWAISAKYTMADTVSVAAGFKGTKEWYAGLSLKAVENLTCDFEAKGQFEAKGDYDDGSADENVCTLVEDIAFQATDALEVGLRAYQFFNSFEVSRDFPATEWVIDQESGTLKEKDTMKHESAALTDSVLKFNPHVKFGINDVFAVSAESSIYVYTTDDWDPDFTITPALWITPADNATINVFYTADIKGDKPGKDGDTFHHMGVGLCVKF